MKLLDSHCHLEPKDYPSVDEIVARARAAGVDQAVVVGLWQRPGDFGVALELARRFPGILFPTVGVHPHDAAAVPDDDWAALEALAARPEVVAVGETGFDFFYLHSPREAQAAAFRRQCRLAKRLGKALVVHVRDAHADSAAVLEEEGVGEGMIHCFTGDLSEAQRYLGLGLHLSISGVVTYKKSEALQEAVRRAPLERLLLETDSPYLAPGPYRGKRNEPAYVVETARKVAELRGEVPELVAAACAENTRRLLHLPKPPA